MIHNIRLLQIPPELQERYQIKDEIDARMEGTQIVFVNYNDQAMVIDTAELEGVWYIAL